MKNGSHVQSLHKNPRLAEADHHGITNQELYPRSYHYQPTQGVPALSTTSDWYHHQHITYLRNCYQWLIPSSTYHLPQELLPVIDTIVNISLAPGTVPPVFKMPQVTPHSMDPSACVVQLQATLESALYFEDTGEGGICTLNWLGDKAWTTGKNAQILWSIPSGDSLHP